MNANQGNAAAAEAQASFTLQITREFSAPRKLVYTTWLDVAHWNEWFAPKDFEIFGSSAEVRVGGAWRSGMRSPEGVEYWHYGEFRELSPVARIAFTHLWEPQLDQPTHETLVTIELEELGAKRTRMLFTHAGFTRESDRDSHHGGWSECFDRIATFVSAQSEVQS